MVTNRQITSEIINDLRLLDIDRHISRRFVLHKLKKTASTLISQKLLDRTLVYEYNIYSDIKCLPLVKVDVVKCDIVEFRTCNKVMKSKYSLPDVIYSRLGSSVKEVTNIDSSLEFKEITLDQYRRDQKRKFKGSTYVFYINTDGHLYIPIKDSDIEIERVDLKLITVSPEKIPLIAGCNEDKCVDGWDFPFIVPDKLYKAVYKDTLAELSSIYRQLPNNEK